MQSHIVSPQSARASSASGVARSATMTKMAWTRRIAKHSTTTGVLQRPFESAIRTGLPAEGVACTIHAMERTEHAGQRSPVFWGVWGICTALAVTLFDWYRNRHFDSWLEIAGRIAIFVAVGIFLGPFVSKRMRARGDKTPTRAASIARFALFILLMLALAYVLWVMAKA